VGKDSSLGSVTAGSRLTADPAVTVFAVRARIRVIRSGGRQALSVPSRTATGRFRDPQGHGL